MKRYLIFSQVKKIYRKLNNLAVKSPCFRCGTRTFSYNFVNVTDTFGMIVWVCVTIVILSLLVLPLPFRIEGKVSAFENDGSISVYIFGLIKIFTVATSVHKVDAVHSDLVLSSHGKEKYYHINSDKRDEKSVAKLLEVDFFPNVSISEIAFEIKMGKRDDAFTTVFLAATVRTAVCIFLAGLKNIQRVKVYDIFEPVFNVDCFCVEFCGIIDLSVADIIYGIVFNRKKTERRKNDYTKKRASD